MMPHLPLKSNQNHLQVSGGVALARFQQYKTLRWIVFFLIPQSIFVFHHAHLHVMQSLPLKSHQITFAYKKS